MSKCLLSLVAGLLALLLTPLPVTGAPRDLQVGVAEHAFDHSGTIGEQAETAAACGETILYVSGVGGMGYQGLLPADAMTRQQQASRAYVKHAKRQGIRLAIGYICATSIVKLETFDKNWSPDFRVRFRLPPTAWRQQDRKCKPLPSWYGGDYQPACMNNPDWRTYERFMVAQQLAAGCDGIFFDNPTVHPQGCYCEYCMAKFGQFLQHQGRLPGPGLPATAALRALADQLPAVFMEFRGTIARDFLAEMRGCARSIKHDALITANNSLNAPDALYSQCRTYAYNIYELSQVEDFVMVEDMCSQPRTRADGQVIEYGPTYRQLQAISHGKPVVAVTVADADYQTPPHLMRLAMAEAAANGASYLAWPTWPSEQRGRMSSLVRPQADLLRQNTRLLNDARARRDVVLFLPFRKWLITAQCQASGLAAELARANVQFAVICEDDLGPAAALDHGILARLRGAKVLLAGTSADFTARERERLEPFMRVGGAVITAEKADWLSAVRGAMGEPSIVVQAGPAVRAVVWDQPHRTMVHLLNLNVQGLSSFEDRVNPAADVSVSVRVPLRRVHSVRALTADVAGTAGALPYTTTATGRETLVHINLPHLEIATILLIE